MQRKTTDNLRASEQIAAEFTLRPLRFAYIVNRDTTQDKLKKVYQFNSSLWGGFYNLFVPSDGRSIRSDWLRTIFMHDPDIVFFVGAVDENVGSDLYDRLQPLQMFGWDDEILNALKGESTKVNPLLVDSILEHVLSVRGRHSSDESLLRYPAIAGEYASYFEVMCGAWLPESRYFDYATSNLGMRLVDIAPNSLRSYLQTLEEIDKWLLPLKLTKLNIEVKWEGFQGFGKYVVILSDGSIDDLFIYHALRWSILGTRERPAIIILPISLIVRDEDYEQLAQWYAEKVGGNTFDVVSYSIELDSLRDFRRKLKEFLPARQTLGHESADWVVNIHRCNIHVPQPTATHLKRTQIIDIANNRYSFAALKPVFIDYYRQKRYENKRWICEFDPSFFAGGRHGFAPSMFHDLGWILSDQPNPAFFQWFGTRIRVARGRLAIATTLQDDIAAFRLPTDATIIDTACANSGFQVLDRKSYFQGAVNLVGNLRDFSFLTDPNVFKLFFNKDMNGGKALTIHQMHNALKIHSNERADFENRIQSLSGKEVLLRGYTLKCPICGMKSWYEMTRVEEFMRCDGCRAAFQIPPSIEFSYRFNSLFTEGHNEGTLAVLLTLFLLHSTASDGMIWQTDVRLRNSEEEEIELDILAMCDGYLVVAECKNSFIPIPKDGNDKSFKSKRREAIERLKEQLEKEIRAASNLNASLFLLATLEENIPREVITFLQERDSSYPSLNIRLVTREELVNAEFQKEDTTRRTSMYDLAKDANLPPMYDDTDCSDHDASGPRGAFSYF